MANAPHSFGYAGRFLFRQPGSVCFRREAGAPDLCESHPRMISETIIRVLQAGLIGRLLLRSFLAFLQLVLLLAGSDTVLYPGHFVFFHQLVSLLNRKGAVPLISQFFQLTSEP